MSTLKLIASSSWGIYNKEIAKKIGLDEAILLGELASEHDYWLKNGGLTDEGYFFSTVENIEKETTLSDHKQRKAMNTLKSLKLIDIQLKGLPAKRYIKMNEIEIEKLLMSGESNNTLRTSSVKSKELDLEKVKSNNNKDNNNKDTISKDIGESKDSPSNKSNNKSNIISNKNKKISLDDLENMTYLDIESNFRKSQNQRVLLAYINKSINSKKIIEELTEWLQLSYLHKRPLYLSGLINQLELLNGFSEEEIISIIKNCTLADKSTFKYEIEKREREKKYQNYNKQNQPRITEQKRTSSLGNEVF